MGSFGGEWHLAGRSTLSLGVNGVNVECLEPHHTSCSLPASCVWVPCDQPASRSAGVPHSSSWEPKATRFYPNSFITATEKEEKQLYVPNEKVGIRMEVSLLRATLHLSPHPLHSVTMTTLMPVAQLLQPPHLQALCLPGNPKVVWTPPTTH